MGGGGRLVDGEHRAGHGEPRGRGGREQRENPAARQAGNPASAWPGRLAAIARGLTPRRVTPRRVTPRGLTPPGPDQQPCQRGPGQCDEEGQ